VETRFCPLHGDYPADSESTACPQCREDPIGSSASLRQVRVVPEEKLDPRGSQIAELTPVADEVPCPICGTMTRLDEFRTETIGEVWTGQAAVWAEEGVCSDCYRDVLGPNIRDWTDAEWLWHHFEGWRNSVDAVQQVVVHEDSPQDGWMPDEEPRRVLDVEKTLAARREHLARCQMAMRDLQGRYPASLTPPPFNYVMAQGAESVSARAVAELKGQRARDLERDAQRRQDSLVARSPLFRGPGASAPGGATRSGSRPAAAGPSARNSRPGSPGDAPAERPVAPPLQGLHDAPSEREAWVFPVAVIAALAAALAAFLSFRALMGP
jgi:hypothetical protein